MRYWYYPGCSLHSTAREYDLSARSACQLLGIELQELDDWNCCGASSVHGLYQHEAALALPARNVMLAQGEPLDMAVPCADCFYHCVAADVRLRSDAAFRHNMERLTNRTYVGDGRPRALLDVLGNDVPVEEIQKRVVTPLTDLRPAVYYGCLLVRPPDLVGRWDDPEHPLVMGRLLEAIGSRPVKWSYTVECCGASLAIGRSDVVARLVGRIVGGAVEAGANCIVTACPMCQANLDSRQGARSTPLPIFYFTELLAWSLGAGDVVKWLRRHLVKPPQALMAAAIMR